MLDQYLQEKRNQMRESMLIILEELFILVLIVYQAHDFLHSSINRCQTDLSVVC